MRIPDLSADIRGFIRSVRIGPDTDTSFTDRIGHGFQPYRTDESVGSSIQKVDLKVWHVAQAFKALIFLLAWFFLNNTVP